MPTIEPKLKTITDLIRPYYIKYNKKIVNEYDFEEYDNKFLDALINIFIQNTKKIKMDMISDILEILGETDDDKRVHIVSRVYDIHEDGEGLGGYEDLKQVMKPKDFEQLINEVTNNIHY